VITIIQPVDKVAVIVFAHAGAVGDRTSCSGSNGSRPSGLNTRCSNPQRELVRFDNRYDGTFTDIDAILK
jgi:hypothetical protein